MAYDIGPKIGIDGEAQFRSQLQSVSQTIKTLGTEMDVVTTSFLTHEKSMDDLVKQQGILNSQIDAVKEKIALQSQMIEEAASKFGESATETQKWEQALNKSQAELNKLQGRLSDVEGEMDSFGKETDDAGKSLDDVEKSMDDAGAAGISFGDILKANVISDAIVGGIRALGDAAKEMASALKDTVIDGAAFADEILTLSTNTGLSTDALQEYQYMAELTDTSLDVITGSMAKLTKNMSTASKGTGDAAAAFSALGVSVVDSNGELRSNEVVFGEVIDALAAMENETQRDAYAMQIFGKSAQELNSFMAQGSEGIAALAEEAHNVGYVLDAEALDALGGVDDSMQRLTGTVTSLKNNLAAKFAPAVSTVVDAFTNLLSGQTDINEFIQTISGLVMTAVQGITNNLPALAQSAVSIMQTLITGIQGLLPELVPVAVSAIFTLVEGLLMQLPAIIETAAILLTTLAQGLAESIPSLIPTIVDVVMGIVETLTDPETLVPLIGAALDLILALGEGLIKAIPELIESLPVIVQNVVESVVTLAPMLIGAALELMVQLAFGLIQAIPELVKSIPQVITGIVNGLKNGLSKIKDVGKNIVTGLWEGVQNMWSWLTEKLGDLCGGLVDGIKNLFGIHSPSTVFAGIGGYLAEGLGIGFEDEMDGMANRMQKSIPTPTMEFQTAMAGAVNGMQTAMTGLNNGGTYTINLMLPDGTALARYQLPALIEVARSSGTPILNPT